MVIYTLKMKHHIHSSWTKYWSSFELTAKDQTTELTLGGLYGSIYGKQDSKFAIVKPVTSTLSAKKEALIDIIESSPNTEMELHQSRLASAMIAESSKVSHSQRLKIKREYQPVNEEVCIKFTANSLKEVMEGIQRANLGHFNLKGKSVEVLENFHESCKAITETVAEAVQEIMEEANEEEIQYDETWGEFA